MAPFCSGVVIVEIDLLDLSAPLDETCACDILDAVDSDVGANAVVAAVDSPELELE